MMVCTAPGHCIDVVAPINDYTRPTGQWNETRIIVRGWKIEHWLNGRRSWTSILPVRRQETRLHSKFRLMPKFATLLGGMLRSRTMGPRQLSPHQSFVN